jgi:probable rRNA maturation factor
MEAPTTEPDRPRSEKDLISCDVLGSERWLSEFERERFVRHAREAADLVFAPSAARIGIRVVDDASMAEAHVRYSGVAGTTDVLTFDLSEPGGPAEADLLICADVAAREAGARGTTIWRELLLYAVHGMLHCAGHDDHTEADADLMHAREDAILAAIGVGRVYAAHEGGRP